MAIENKRMQQRYGTYTQFDADKSNLLPHEFASVTANDPNTTSGKALYFYSGSGEPTRLLTDEDKTSIDSGITSAANNAAEALNVTSSLQVGLNNLQSTVQSQGSRIYSIEAVIDDKVEMDDVYAVFDSTLSGSGNTAPMLRIDDTVDQTYNPDGNVILYYTDSSNVRHNLFDFSDEFTPYYDMVDYVDNILFDYARKDEAVPTKTVGFDTYGIPAVILNSTTYSGGACANTDIVKLYVPKTVTRIDGGAFTGCTALTDVYIDNTTSGIFVSGSAFLNGVTIHYHTVGSRMIFNAVDELIKAVHSLEEDIANGAY